MRLLLILAFLHITPITVVFSQEKPSLDKTNVVDNAPISKQLKTDYHVHIQSPEMGRLLSGFCGKLMYCDPVLLSKGSNASDLLPKMQASQINRLVIMSTAYQAGMSEFNLSIDEQKRLTSKENSYIADEISTSEHLLGFFGVNPLSSYALEESQYWMGQDDFSGLKLHFASSGVDLYNLEHIKKVQALLDAVDKKGMTIMIHLRTRNPEYGSNEVDIFFRDLMPHISKANVIIAHAGGWGGYDEATHAVLGKFIKTINNNVVDRERIYLGVGAIITPSLSEERKSLFINTFRSLNIENWVFASDWFPGSNEIGHGLYVTALKQAGMTDKEISNLVTVQLPFVN